MRNEMIPANRNYRQAEAWLDGDEWKGTCHPVIGFVINVDEDSDDYEPIPVTTIGHINNAEYTVHEEDEDLCTGAWRVVIGKDGGLRHVCRHLRDEALRKYYLSEGLPAASKVAAS